MARATQYGYSLFEGTFKSPGSDNTLPPMATTALAFPANGAALAAPPAPQAPLETVQFTLPDGTKVTPTGPISGTWRTVAGGGRSDITETKMTRALIGAKGTIAGWDYDTALNHSVNTVKDKDTHGYLLYDKLLEGIADGRINPFGQPAHHRRKKHLVEHGRSGR